MERFVGLGVVADAVSQFSARVAAGRAAVVVEIPAVARVQSVLVVLAQAFADELKVGDCRSNKSPRAVVVLVCRPNARQTRPTQQAER